LAASLVYVEQPGRNKLADAFRDCPDCPEMVVVPAGSFQMGNPKAELQHSVSINSFAIGMYEVTQGQWRVAMGRNPSGFSSCGDDCPVERVSWDDAQEYIKKLSQKTGKQYRLPSAAEWEYACRAGAQQQYCGSDNLDAVGWYNRNSGKTTHPVGQKQPNAFGLYDMSGKQPNAWGLYDMTGNVWEKTQDCWNESYNGAPTDGSARGSSDCGIRVLRGGSKYSDPRGARAAVRFGLDSAIYDRNGNGGFRLSRTLP